jgi:small multidrug resistance pump
MNPWLILSLSILSEVVGTILLKMSNGLTKPIPTITMGICYVGAIWLMGIAAKHMEIGLTYAIWAGVGTALTAILGVFFFSENFSFFKTAGVTSIIIGVVLLNLSQKS